MLAAGDRAPDFSVRDQNNALVTLTGLLARGAVILYFYPADFTPGCTREACFIRDLHGELARAGLQVAGISPQSPESHMAFAHKHALPFTLLADPDKSVAHAYGVLAPFGLGVRRATFLIDPSGIIHDALRADFRIGRHEEFMRRALATKR